MDKPIYNSPVLKLFFRDPTTRVHIRELARRTGLHPNTVLRDTKLLVKDELLTTAENRAVKEVAANQDNPRFTLLKRIANIEEIMLSGIVEFLNEKYGTPSAIIVFGSYSRGEDRVDSDVDIAVLTTRKQKLDFSVYQKTLDRNIHIIEVVPPIKDKDFLSSLANGIVLKGYLPL
jgi:predicted nucleotidyltransferase